MKLGHKEREAVYRYNIEECSDTERENLKKMAIERFAKDENAQMEYAAKVILRDAVEEDPSMALPLLLDMLKTESESRQKEKNGNTNNSRE